MLSKGETQGHCFHSTTCPCRVPRTEARGHRQDRTHAWALLPLPGFSGFMGSWEEKKKLRDEESHSHCHILVLEPAQLAAEGDRCRRPAERAASLVELIGCSRHSPHIPAT